jgi:4-hydroxybenzoate polyprenyltransferase
LTVARRAYLELLRPANVVTAIADVLAGYAVAGGGQGPRLPWLLAATACLYAGGVVLNDYFDRGVDARERPERPIPSGRVPARAAGRLGGALLAAGVLLAFGGTMAAGAVAVALAACVILYDTRANRHAFAGPFVMGACRGLNLVLGMAAVPAAVAAHWGLGILPVVYIAAVTMVSRGEVHGGRKHIAAAALAALGGVVAALAVIALRSHRSAIPALVIAAALAWRVGPPFAAVLGDPRPAVIRRAVKAGVLSLVLLDAAISAAYAGPVYAAVVLATALVAGSLALLFSVT